jgi:hypothetical protein
VGSSEEKWDSLIFRPSTPTLSPGEAIESLHEAAAIRRPYAMSITSNGDSVPVPSSSRGVRAPLQIRAALDEMGEGLGVIQKDSVIGHFLVVRLKRSEGLGIGNQLKDAGNGCGIVDGDTFVILVSGCEDPQFSGAR